MGANQKRIGFLYETMPNYVPGVYCILNTYNHKRYIGFSKNVRRRVNEHYLELIKNAHLHYGKDIQLDWNTDNTCWEATLLETTSDKQREAYWTTFYNSNVDGYNDSIGTKLSVKRVDEIKACNTGRIRSEETKQKIRDANLGKHVSDETRAKMSKPKPRKQKAGV